MRILVVAMFEGVTQNPKIMRILCAEFERMGHQVIRFFPCSNREVFSDHLKCKNDYAVYMPLLSKYDSILRQLVLNRRSFSALLKILIKHPFFIFEYLIRRFAPIDDLIGKPGIVKREIQKCCKHNDFDIVLVGSNPFFLVHGVAKAKCNPLKVWFQMDPHSNNGMIRKSMLNRESKSELYVYKHVDRVFVQPNSYEEIIDKYELSIAKKVFPTNFPLVIPDTQVSGNESFFCSNTINCVYSGALMMSIRRPEYMLNLFSHFSNRSIHLYIWCNNLSDESRAELLSLLPSNVTFCGALPQNDMQCVLAGADFLVNLGNSITNQLPSKLLDYISLRKPIINIYKNDKCPTRDIISNYPLAISISENEDINMAASKVECFINENIGNRVDSQIVSNNYHDYLPEVVADYLLSKIT